MIKKDIEVLKAKKVLDILVDNSFSYSQAQKMLRNKDIRVNGKVCKENVKLNIGDILTLFYKEEIKPYEIVYEDEECVIINKFAGIEVENGLDNILGTFPVHRLDRNTSGLLMIAKNNKAHEFLAEQIKNHTITKFIIIIILPTESI